MKAKVLEVRCAGGVGIAEALEKALNEFLAKNAKITIDSTHVQALDIGGPSEADILVLCTVFYH